MAPVTRPEQLSIAGITLPLPAFFPSISTVKSRLRPLAYLRLLVGLDYPQFLLSAYDLHHSPPREAATIRRLLRAATRRGRIVLMDSGNYEAFWLRDTERWSVRRLSSVLRGCEFHLAFGFDYLKPPSGITANVKAVEASVLRAQTIAGNGTVVPIVHGGTARLPSIVGAVARRLAPLLIGVPERELGAGLIERAKTIAKIRMALDQLGHYYNLHILGTGNPLSILVYSLSGADSFDGLEWCQTAADADTARLYHLTQWDLFRRQSGLDLSRLPYATRVLIHNLWFYAQWLDRVRWAVRTRQGAALLDEYLPKEAADQVRDILPSEPL